MGRMSESKGEQWTRVFFRIGARWCVSIDSVLPPEMCGDRTARTGRGPNLDVTPIVPREACIIRQAKVDP